MKISEIVDICEGKLLCGNKDEVVNSFSKDTRTISPEDMYVAIKGEKFDGNDYLDAAFEKGVKTALISKTMDVSHYDKQSIILVEDTVKALGKLAEYKRSKFNGHVIGITGSVGKTTTKDLIVNILSSKYKVLYTIGNSNNNIGMPLSILNSGKADIWVIEMGMNNFGEISYLSKIVKPTISVITNIGTAHIGKLGSRENILKAKLEILDGMENKMLIINNDNDLLHEYSLSNSVISVGINNKSHYMCTYNNDEIYFNNKLVKLFSNEVPFIINSLLAYAAADIVGVSFDDVKKCLESFKLEGNRLNYTENSKDITIINDSYNASLDSVKLAISILSKYNGRKIFVFGDILELGEYSKDIHEEVGLTVNQNDIDVFVCVGNDSKYAYDVCSKEKYYFKTNDECALFLNDFLKKSDIFLFKASNGMKLSEIVNQIK